MRYYYNKKPTAEGACDITIFQLKKMGMLIGRASTVIEWKEKNTGKETSIGLLVDIINEPHATFTYSTIDRDGNQTDYKYDVTLTTTVCTFGGIRYWFLCPVCYGRVGALYLIPGDVQFACRHCNNITYHSRNRCIMGTFGHTSRQIDKLRSEIKRQTWRGRPTRKVRRLNALEQKMQMLGGAAMARIDNLRARLR